MITVTEQTYEGFKNTFSALGGSRKTTVLTSANAGTGGAFNALAVLNDGFLQIGLGAQPDTFSTDFPQAVAVDQYGTGA